MSSDRYLITPRSGRDVCPDCFNFTLADTGRCRACTRNGAHLDAIVPISYAPGGGRLHRELADYKRAADPSVPPVTLGLARILSTFLGHHERCVAGVAGVERFGLVTTVPSGDPRRDIRHPLRTIVGRLVPETADRHQRILRSTHSVPPHRFDPERFTCATPLSGQAVLLIDDVWTTGASAQSAAIALKHAGATVVAAVVIGRYVNGWWGEIAERIDELGDPPTGACALCAGGGSSSLAA